MSLAKDSEQHFNQTGWTFSLLFNFALSVLVILAALLFVVASIMRCKSKV